MKGPSEPNPYRAPQAQLGSAALREAPPGFVDQSVLVLGLTALLGLQAAGGAVNTVVCLSLNLVLVDGAAEEQLVELSNGLATGQNALYYLTIIPFAIFLVQANRNARITSGVPLEYTPASMVWWFAVPFLNFVRPYQAVRAVWEASAPGTDEYTTRHGYLVLWWALWLSAALFAKLGPMLAKDSGVEGQNFVAVISNVLSAGLAGAALLLVRGLNQRQLASARGTD